MFLSQTIRGLAREKAVWFVAKVLSKSSRLAAELVKSLLCGLPRMEHRLAVFVSASDESGGKDHRSLFWHLGFVAPAKDWFDHFSPAWQERVLDAAPAIPYLHMTEIRDREWRKKHNLTDEEAENKIDEAIAVIDSVRSLYPLGVKTNAGVFLDAFGSKKVLKMAASDKPKRFLVDHSALMVMRFSFSAMSKRDTKTQRE